MLPVAAGRVSPRSSEFEGDSEYLRDLEVSRDEFDENLH